MLLELKTFLIYSVLLIAVMLVAEIAYRWLKLSSEWTRKIAHVGSGIVALTYPEFIQSHWIVLALTISFIVILYASKKMGLFQSIFSVERKSYGEILFVVSTWLLFLLFKYTGDSNYYMIPFALVVFADPAAALVGKNLPLKKYTIFGNSKSIGGSLAFFLTGISIVLGTGLFAEHYLFSIVFVVVLTFVEAVSFKGWDNFTIPFAAVLMQYVIFSII
jgi:dolichol kinase